MSAMPVSRVFICGVVRTAPEHAWLEAGVGGSVENARSDEDEVAVAEFVPEVAGIERFAI
jgi:hypothetical protein